MPAQLTGGGEVSRLQQGGIRPPEPHYSRCEVSEVGVLYGVLGDDGGALTQQAAGQEALGQGGLLTLLTCQHTGAGLLAG